MGKLSNILQGWSNIIWPSPDMEQMAISRAIICAPCKFNKWGACFKCMCPLEAKLRSPNESCPLNKWQTHDTKN